jgi:hypothetical protein
MHLHFTDVSAAQQKNGRSALILPATTKISDCQHSGTCLQHLMGELLVMGLVAL